MRTEKQNRGNPNPSEATRFKPGQSGNPGGRPKNTPFKEACRTVASMIVADLRIEPNDTVDIANAKALAREAIKGKTQASIELANRAEGTPTQRVEHSGADGEPIAVDIRARLAEKLLRD